MAQVSHDIVAIVRSAAEYVLLGGEVTCLELKLELPIDKAADTDF